MTSRRAGGNIDAEPLRKSATIGSKRLDGDGAVAVGRIKGACHRTPARFEFDDFEERADAPACRALDEDLDLAKTRWASGKDDTDLSRFIELDGRCWVGDERPHGGGASRELDSCCFFDPDRSCGSSHDLPERHVLHDLK